MTDRTEIEKQTQEEHIAVLKSALWSHRSISEHQNFNQFLRAVARVTARLTSLYNQRSQNHIWDQGATVRAGDANKALIALARVIGNMAPSEISDWVPPTETTLQAIGGSRKKKRALEQAIKDWPEVTVAMASIIQMRIELERPDSTKLPRKAERIQAPVSWLAQLWETNFDKPPLASENSPFTTLYKTYAELSPQAEAASHKTIGRALRAYKDKNHR